MKYIGTLLYIVIVLYYITATQYASPQWVTIFVHGIISVRPYLSFSNMTRFMRDDIANSEYEKAIECVRKNPYFHQHHPMQKLGLHIIDTSVVAPGASASCFARLYDEITHSNGNVVHDNLYYTFGWSGLLSAKMRYLEAKILYDELCSLIETLTEACPNHNRPKIRIVGYSHGGNIALNLALIQKQQNAKRTKITIDELILIGMPVVPESDYLINDPMFKKIYHFYSYGDRVQRIDIFSSHRILSQRTFKPRDHFCIPAKLTQIELHLTRLLRPHCCWNHQALKYYASQCSGSFNERFMRNADPGHSELWSFGWTPCSYRNHLPIYPLPMALFLSYLVNTITHYMPCCPKITIDIHPFNQEMIIKDRCTCTSLCVPFFSPQQLASFKRTAWLYKPIHYAPNIFHTCMRNVIRSRR